jgi:hypothetical protein
MIYYAAPNDGFWTSTQEMLIVWVGIRGASEDENKLVAQGVDWYGKEVREKCDERKTLLGNWGEGATYIMSPICKDAINYVVFMAERGGAQEIDEDVLIKNIVKEIGLKVDMYGVKSFGVPRPEDELNWDKLQDALIEEFEVQRKGRVDVWFWNEVPEEG